MLDNISRTRLAEVHPKLSERIYSLANALDPKIIRVTRGVATVAQQNALWQIGRDAQGNKIAHESVVTNAKGTQSNHVMGFAVDLVVMDEQGTPVWNDQPWVEMAPSYGLRSGAAWGDRPHLELAEVPTEPTGEIQQTFVDGGIGEVWKATEV